MAIIFGDMLRFSDVLIYILDVAGACMVSKLLSCIGWYIIDTGDMDGWMALCLYGCLPVDIGTY